MKKKYKALLKRFRFPCTVEYPHFPGPQEPHFFAVDGGHQALIPSNHTLSKSTQEFGLQIDVKYTVA